MNKPYRELALVPMQPAELAPLVPFRTARRGSPCPKCLAEERVRETLNNQPCLSGFLPKPSGIADLRATEEK